MNAKPGDPPETGDCVLAGGAGAVYDEGAV
jgi:hypothetical protein